MDSEKEELDFDAPDTQITASADARTVQTIMRHSDIKLTRPRYGHLFLGPESDAVSKIRSAFASPSQELHTGTDGKSVKQSERGPVLIVTKMRLGRLANRRFLDRIPKKN